MPPKAPKRYFLIPLILLPGAVFGYVLLNDSVNFPIIDDYYAILGFLNNYATASDDFKRALLFSQNNEHIITTTYLAELLILKLAGQFNFQYLLLLAGGLLFGTLLVMHRMVNLKNLPYWYFLLPACYLLLHLQYSEMTLWPMAAFSHIACSFFAFCFIYALNRRTLAGTALAALFLALAVFSNGNGVFLFPFGLLLLLLQKRYRALAGFALLSGYLLWEYFSRYTNYGGGRSYGIGLHNLFEVIWFNLTLTGNYTDVFSRALAPFTGIATLLGFAYLVFFKRLDRVNPALLAMTLFFLESLAIITISRFRDGADMAHRPLYSFYSNMVLVLLVGGVLAVHDVQPVSRRLRPALLLGLAATAGFWLATYQKYYPTVLYFKHLVMNDAVDWSNRSSVIYLAADRGFTFPKLEFQYELEKASTHKNFTVSLNGYVSKPVEAAATAGNACGYTEQPEAAGQYKVIEVDGFLNVSSPYVKIRAESAVTAGDIFVVLQSRQGCYLFSTYRSLPKGLRNVITNPWLMAVIPKSAFPAGAYRIGFAYREGGTLRASFTSQYLDTGFAGRAGGVISAPVTVNPAAQPVVDVQHPTVRSCEYVNGRLNLLLQPPASADTARADTATQVYLALKSGDRVNYFTGRVVEIDSVFEHAAPVRMYYASVPLDAGDYAHQGRSVKNEAGVGRWRQDVLHVNYAQPVVTVPLQSIPSTRVPFPSLGGLLADHTTQDISFTINQVVNQADQIIVEGWAGAPSPVIDFSKIYFAAASAEDTAVFQAAKIDRPDVVAHLRAGNPQATSTGFFLTLPKGQLTPGQEHVLYFVAEDSTGKRAVQKVNQLDHVVFGGCSRPVVTALPGQESDAQVVVDKVALQPETGCVSLSGWCLVRSLRYARQELTFVVEDGKRVLGYRAVPVSRPDVQHFFKSQGQDMLLRDGGYSVNLPAEALGGGSRVGVLITVDGRPHLKWINPEQLSLP